MNIQIVEPEVICLDINNTNNVIIVYTQKFYIKEKYIANQYKTLNIKLS